ncbi:MAG TPA: PsbP-related protein [Candidatus Dojkabacteria bacterium]|nr:PsbP-related protein [Candidatus Dojkabacteria bacterium]
MNEGNSKALPLILGILFILGMGVGGYYLGKTIDTQAYEEEKAKNPVVDLSSQVKKYTNDDLGISFDYPGDWGILEYEPKDDELIESFDATLVTVTSPNGSQFIYTNQTMTKALAGYTERCDSNDPNGNEGDNKKCIFIGSGDTDFARYETDDPNISPGWNIAELGDVKSNPDLYLFSPADSFQYYVAKESDLTVLDKIMGSVTRQ